jgi:hypothetical protein
MLLMVIAAGSMEAQCLHIDELIEEGDIKFRRKDYLGAINKYQAAITDCSDRSSVVQPKILKVFREIEMLRKEAEMTKDSLRHMLQELGQAQLKLSEALNNAVQERDAAFKERVAAFKAYNEMRSQQMKNQKLLKAFYFYDDSLAIAYRDGKFGFVDKNGDLKIPYKYERANNFYFHGFMNVAFYSLRIRSSSRACVLESQCKLAHGVSASNTQAFVAPNPPHPPQPLLRHPRGARSHPARNEAVASQHQGLF